MMPVADRILTQCEQAIAGGRVDDARKLAHSLGVMTGNPAWERAYSFMLDGGNPMDHITVIKAAVNPDWTKLLHALHDERGQEFANQSVRGGMQVNLTHDERFPFPGAIGVWSTRLQKGGYHIPHIHPRGGQSHVLYIEVPDNQSGHLYFGVSRYSTREPTHSVVPNPGVLVSFPNWLWHGVAPYLGDRPRLTIAWDTENG